MAAAKSGHVDVLHQLVAAGADPTHHTTTGVTALMMACRHDRLEAARYLLQDAKLDLGQVDEHGASAITHAATGGAAQTLTFLLQATQSVNTNLATQSDAQGMTPLHHACLSGSIDCVTALISCGVVTADWTCDPVLLTQLLSLAARAGQAQMLSWLLAKGEAAAQRCLLEPGSSNAIFAAVRGGSEVGVRALLAAGVRLEVQDHK
jgi:ankyrin repeat protein